MEGESKGTVCVTGGTGFVASWLIKRLLQQGYSVNTTVRSSPQDSKEKTSYLTSLPGASERLRIFQADLDKPGSFDSAIKGCIGVFHVAHPIDLTEKETAEMKINKSISGTLGILQACLDSKTVKRVVYTSSAATVVDHNKDLDVVDENLWTDVDYVRRSIDNNFAVSYITAKTLTERAALEFAEKHSLDLVTVIPTWIHGPFICSRLPGSVSSSLAMIIGNQNVLKYTEIISFVHTDDVANAHIFLFECPNAKGRYICSAVEITVDNLAKFLSTRYPEFQIRNEEDLIERGRKLSGMSSKKLLDTGFRYKYGLEEMFDEAIQCCREKGFL
ncbi:vestitone reductase-like [Olea europaea var. sylvestris]|uniref:vestitone reductase-like n=1 Tax=Olea europaea var. sylvestris TaxID=158386 RepID=UPI000C1D558F|nr:vestitone reductase-like [Olea europaea var. sylvestris]